MTYTAIETKALPATNFRGTRIKASEMDTMPSKNRAISLTESYAYELSTLQNHQAVAINLHKKVCTSLRADESCPHVSVFGSTAKGYVMVVYVGTYVSSKKEREARLLASP